MFQCKKLIWFSRPIQCTSCEPGKRCDKQGLKMPETCPVGHHCNNTALMIHCQPGTYQNDQNMTSCKLCELGHFCPNHGMDTTVACHIGTYQNQTGQTQCINCPEKTICSKGMKIICIYLCRNYETNLKPIFLIYKSWYGELW